MESLNRMAIELADEALDFAEELNVIPYELESGATVLDFGVEADGGLEAGLLLVELQTAGLATVQSRMDTVDGSPFPHVEVATDHPGLALLGAQKAGWELGLEDFEGLASGPARALVAEESEFRALEYVDVFELAVLTIETDQRPTESVAEHVAERAELTPEVLYLPVYRTASIAGATSGAARAAELAVFRLFEAGYDPTHLLSAAGSAPIPPVPTEEATAMGRTSDAISYGGDVHLTVTEDHEALSDVASTAAVTYGDPFGRIYEHVDWELSRIDPSVYGPARVTIDVRGGPTYTAGERHEEILAESFELD
ncbi:MAG: methenyltetrahydromethanopterin cyclohydrolase [Halodesulfurarchaeum sp.]